MIVKTMKMVTDHIEILCQQRVSVEYLCVSTPPAPAPVDDDLDLCVFSKADSVSVHTSRSDSGVRCSTSTQTIVDETRSNNFLPAISSGSYTDVGSRRSNEDEHIRVDDLSAQLGSLYNWPLPGAFYAVFDGHGGPDAAAYVKTNAMRFFFEDADLPQASVVDQVFLEELESSHCRAFLTADRALADECTSVNAACGTTAITALVLGRHLVVANAGDCRAVLSRKGAAVQLSQDHRPTCLAERQRVEKLGGVIEYGCLNGDLAVTRALGDWYMKLPFGSASPLTAEPEVKQMLLTEDDEFMIIGCDGIWDVMSNQEAVNVVRRELRLYTDPQQAAKELVDQALCRDADDNLTAIVVCFTSPDRMAPLPSQRPRFRCCSMSEEARKKLQSLLGGK